MSFNLIARGILFNFLLNIVVVYALIHYGFDLSQRAFTILLVVNLALLSIFTGISSKKQQSSSEINGLFVGLGSAGVIFLFLSQFVSMNWEVNLLLMTVWMFFGYIGGFVGSKMVKKATI